MLLRLSTQGYGIFIYNRLVDCRYYPNFCLMYSIIRRFAEFDTSKASTQPCWFSEHLACLYGHELIRHHFKWTMMIVSTELPPTPFFSITNYCLLNPLHYKKITYFVNAIGFGLLFSFYCSKIKECLQSFPNLVLSSPNTGALLFCMGDVATVQEGVPVSSWTM
jgi:hypothetical protein